VRSGGTTAALAAATRAHKVARSPSTVTVAIGLIESGRDTDVYITVVADTGSDAAIDSDSKH
jgi:hypothetical protein